MAYILLLFLGSLPLPGILYGQEEESAAISLEQYTDEFQENFFEALKQKGIENYDKAINSLLECKQLDPSSPVIDHELSKVYLANGQPIQALEYGLLSLQAEPGNLWYLETLVIAASQQGNALEVLKGKIPMTNTVLLQNLATVLYRRNDYKAAMEVLAGLKNTQFSEHLESLIRHSLNQETNSSTPSPEIKSPLEAYRSELGELLEKREFTVLDSRSKEVLEDFPSIPYFYYIRGMVLNEQGNFEEAATILEEGLGYLLENTSLEHDFYKALAASYTGLGNPSKASMYLNKIKNGS